jgi:preprotein translocase subunit Sec61beta
VSVAVVGHLDLNPRFARIEDNKVLVEVTLLPSGDEIIAELQDPGGGSGFAFYMPIRIGMRVVVAMPQGEDDSATIVGRLTDETWPYPDDVAGVAVKQGTPDSEPAPQFAFLRTPEGTLLAIETGDGSDIVIKSGASVKIETSPGSQTLLNSEVHIGVDFPTQPTGASTGPAGEVVPGVPAAPFIPVPGTNLVSPGGLAPPVPTVNPKTLQPYPAAGLVRFKDAIQSNATTDPQFWVWVNLVHSAVIAMAARFNAPPGPVLSAPGSVIPPVIPPASLGSVPASSSRSTAAD